MPRRICLWLAGSAMLLCFTPNAHAQPSPTATARELAIEGIDAVESGDCEKGRPLLERAERLHHAAVHLQYLARCNVKEGKFVAATEMWRRIISEGVAPEATPAVHAAYDEAQRELPKMLPRLAKTSLVLSARYPDLVVELDGNKLPPEMVEAPQVLDPGDHALIAKARGYASFTHRWTLHEGETQQVTIHLTPSNEPGAGSTNTTKDQGVQGGGKSDLPLIGWITMGAGGVALIAGTVTWLSRNSRRDDLRAKCSSYTGATASDTICNEPGEFTTKGDYDNAKSSVESLTLATNILMIAGGVAVATGATLVLVGGSAANGDHAAASLSVAPTRSGAALWLYGHF